MSRTSKIALILGLIAIILSSWVSFEVYEGLAQLEDEYAYLWQARLTAHGDLKVPSPPQSHDFVIPFVVDHAGERFSKYPLGWPVLLSIGERFGWIRLVNPLLAGLAIWLTYRLGQKLLGNKVGLLAAGLTLISPLFLTYSGSILSHTWGLVLSLSLAVSWLDVTDQSLQEKNSQIPGWLPTLIAGISLGTLALSRPWTAIGAAIPFCLHGMLWIWRGPNILRKKIIGVGLVTLLIGSIHFVWQYALTGDPLLNPYLLWWPYDKIGFGEGIGIADGGHTLRQGWIHTRNSLHITWQDLWGWGQYSWVLLLVGLWAVRRQKRVWLIVSVFPSLVIIYIAYWVSGPRYFYEGLYSLTILGAAGIAWLTGWMPDQVVKPANQARIRQLLVLAGLLFLIIVGTLRFTPTRLHAIKARYGFSQAVLEPFRKPDTQSFTPALIIVHSDRWWDYGAYLHLENPYLTSPFIFAWASHTGDPSNELGPHFPDRTIYHYYPNQPGEFYTKHLR